MILFPRDEKIYLSFDSILKFYEGIGVQIDWITTGFLNDIRLFGLPAHRLVLKKGILVMVMRKKKERLQGTFHFAPKCRCC